METCTYCTSTSHLTLFPTDDIFGNQYALKKCAQCKVVFLSPKPTPELLAQAYDESYYGEGEEKFNKGWIEKLLDYFRGQRAHRFARAMGFRGKVLDIGCGNGRFLQYLAQQGTFETHGIEMPGGSAERAARIDGLKLKIGALTNNDYPKHHFDGVSLIHVFEHLTDPKETLDIIDQILKPNGVLFMSFPNISSFQARWFKGKWFHMDAPRHIFFFEREDFLSLMASRGYELEIERHFTMEYNPFGFQQSLLNTFCKKREVLYEQLKGHDAYVEEYKGLKMWMMQLFFKLSGPLFVLSDVIESAFKRGATVEFILRKKN